MCIAVGILKALVPLWLMCLMKTVSEGSIWRLWVSKGYRSGASRIWAGHKVKHLECTTHFPLFSISLIKCRKQTYPNYNWDFCSFEGRYRFKTVVSSYFTNTDLDGRCSWRWSRQYRSESLRTLAEQQKAWSGLWIERLWSDSCRSISAVGELNCRNMSFLVFSFFLLMTNACTSIDANVVPYGI